MDALVLVPEGKTGHLNQALGVARRLGANVCVKAPSNSFFSGPPETGGATLVIGAGKQSVAPLRRLVKRGAPRPFVAMFQAVRKPSDYDLVWAPSHDRMRARHGSLDTLVETLTAPSVITEAQIAAAARELEGTLAHCAAPRIGVLVGGRSRAHRFGVQEAEDLAARLAAFAKSHDASLLITTSHRTPPQTAQILSERLSDVPHHLYDIRNPGVVPAETAFAGILGLSNGFVVTADSVSMLSEAAATGKPLYGWRLPGGKIKFERFYDGLIRHGALRWFDGGWESWRYQPIDSTAVIAKAIAERMALFARADERM
ncbi:MAG: mitochondrial fission ELM1 family protein [Pseudomonadota bacterium]